MRCLHSSSEYFRFLDNMDAGTCQNPNLAAAALEIEFPALRFEEAKAVFCDWRAHARAQRQNDLRPTSPTDEPPVNAPAARLLT